MGIKVVVAAILAGALVALSSAFGADYSLIPTDELAKMREGMKDAPFDEQRAYEREWQRRMYDMTPEEKEKYLGPMYRGDGGRTDDRERLRERENIRERESIREHRGKSAGPERERRGEGSRGRR